MNKRKTNKRTYVRFMITKKISRDLKKNINKKS